tara:strand:+ start:1271 stop:1477 length:207 start_codon:yes stop_codon:yes gene_type:complete
MKNVSELNNLLMRQLLADLDDPTKCTPGLYQVIRGVVNDNREYLDSLPSEALKEVESIIEQAPFKFGT